VHGRDPVPGAVPRRPLDADLLKVILKADGLLEVLSSHPDGLPLADLSARAGLPKPTARRILNTLELCGYVAQNHRRGSYRLGPRLIELGAKAKSGSPLRRVALPYMKELAEAVGETVFLCVRRGSDALCVERIEGEDIQIVVLQVGGTLPLYLGGAPRCLLASLPDAEIDAILAQGLVPRTPRSPTTPEAVWELVRQTRRQGYSVSCHDVVENVFAVGAPVRDEEGTVVASVSVAGMLPFGEPRVDEGLVARLLDTAGKISARLGWDGGQG
jgi:DNA-binding IclR family transcriptional regulator